MRVIVGRIGKAHGIRGAVTVEVRTDEPEVRFALGSVLITDPEAAGPLVVEGAKWHSGRLLLEFEGVLDRTAAESLRGTLLSVDVDDDARPDDPEEFYDHQLVGLDVVTVEGTPVGTIAEVAHLPSQELLIVRAPDDRDVLIPFVMAIVPTIDLANRRVIVDPPPGLLDEASDAGSSDSESAAE
jgi:16S rRNA processing protein RimM